MNNFLKITVSLTLLGVSAMTHGGSRPDAHAPIGVTADHTHHTGEIMLSYRYMHMSMGGNQQGTSNISPEEIVINTPNRFAGRPAMPPTVRVVPTAMTVDIHMLGAMYAPSKRVTLMGMLSYVEKEMDHITFEGSTGTSRLGNFTTRSSGVGDSTLAALINLGGDHHHSRLHATLGISLPSGSINKIGDILTPTNSRPNVRLPYPMQLGSGTFDLITGLTYSGHRDALGWGAQWKSKFRTGENDADYSLGDEHQLQGWLSYLLTSSMSVSARLEFLDRENISGIDALIQAPVQTADPTRQGLRRLDLGLGANVILPLDGHRLALELDLPLSQDLDGPQLESDWMLTIGWQYSF